jgi:hypothetical protein
MASFDMDKKFVRDAQNAKTRRKPMWVVLIGIALVAAFGITKAVAALGGFDWLLEKADPAFGDVVKPIGQSAVSQGIEVAAVAAESSGDMAIVYVTLEDTEQLGRVAEDTAIGFDLTQSVRSLSAEQIYFDTETGIAAYQIRLGSLGTFDGQPLSLQMNGLSYGKADLGDIRMEIDLAESVAQGEHIGQPYASNLQVPTENLTPGRLADIPGTKSAWVSAVGVNHGYLAVQFAQPANANRYLYANRLAAYLLDPGENIIEWNGPSGTTFKTDEQLTPIHTGQRGAYDFTEIYFAVDTEQLDGYTLCFKGSVRDVISGQWNLDVNFDGLQFQTHEIRADISVGNVQMEDVLLNINPFGMTLTGNGAADLNYCAPMAAATVLETTKGNIELAATNSFRTNPAGPFELVWHASASIDLDSVIAVSIGDNRVVLKGQP